MGLAGGLIALIDPAHTVARLSPQFWRSLALLLTRPRSARANRAAAAWVTGHPKPSSSIDLLTPLFLAGFATFGPPHRTAPLFFAPDRLLRSVHLPVQVLLAGKMIHDSDKAINRMKSMVPMRQQHHLWPHAAHSLPAEAPEEVNACIRNFVLECHLYAVLGDEIREDLALPYLQLRCRAIDLAQAYRLGDMACGYRILSRIGLGPVAAAPVPEFSLVTLSPCRTC